LQAPLAATARSGPISLGLRPEHLVLSPVDSGHGLRAKVVSLELHGGQIFLDLETAETALRLTAVAPARAGYRPGAVVSILLDESKLYPFSQESGELLVSC